MSEGISRRELVRAAIGIPVGAAVAMADFGTTPHIDEAVTDLTNHPTGSAGVTQALNEQCGKASDQLKCEEEFARSRMLRAVTITPLSEEFTFRAIPSMVLDSLSEDGEEQAMPNVIRGANRKMLSRGELITGVISSLIFGALHNLTDKGWDTRTIPASQTVGGFIFWCLQRRLGFLSNVTSHAVFNWRAYSSTK